MARRKAPKRRCQGASDGSWENKASRQLAEDTAGTSRGQSRTLLTTVQLEMPLLPSTASAATQGPAKATGTAGMVFSLAGQLTGALVSLWKSLQSTCTFAIHKMSPQKKTILKGLFLWLPVALAALSCGTWLVVQTMQRNRRVEELARELAAQQQTLRNAQALVVEQSQKMQLLPETVDQLRKEMGSEKKEGPRTAPEVYAEVSDWALKSIGATIDLQRTSKTYDCKELWFCRVLRLFQQFNPPDTILQPDVSPGNCWPLQGHQGQVVIRLPARVHVTAITVQHIYREVSPSGTVISAPKDMAVCGVDADGEEETLLGTFTYDVEREARQTFPLKKAPFPRAFSYIKLLVKSNWGNPAYTCIYRVQVHGKMAEPESLH